MDALFESDKFIRKYRKRRTAQVENLEFILTFDDPDAEHPNGRGAGYSIQEVLDIITDNGSNPNARPLKAVMWELTEKDKTIDAAIIKFMKGHIKGNKLNAIISKALMNNLHDALDIITSRFPLSETTIELKGHGDFLKESGHMLENLVVRTRRSKE